MYLVQPRSFWFGVKQLLLNVIVFSSFTRQKRYTGVNLKIDFNFSVCPTFSPIILCVYYFSFTLMGINDNTSITFLKELTIRKKRIMGLKLRQIQVQIMHKTGCNTIFGTENNVKEKCLFVPGV